QLVNTSRIFCSNSSFHLASEGKKSLTPRGVRKSIINASSFPFNGCRGLAADIINHAVYPLNLMQDPSAHPLEQIIREANPVCSHAILTVNRSEGNYMVIGTVFFQHSYSSGISQNCQCLPYLAVPSRSPQLFNENSICFP